MQKSHPLTDGPGVFTCAENKKTAAARGRGATEWVLPKNWHRAQGAGAMGVGRFNVGQDIFSFSDPFSLFFLCLFFLLRYLGGGKQVRGLEEKVGCDIFSPGGKSQLSSPQLVEGQRPGQIQPDICL